MPSSLKSFAPKSKKKRSTKEPMVYIIYMYVYIPMYIWGWLFNVEPIYGPDHLSIIIKKQSEKNKKS